MNTTSEDISDTPTIPNMKIKLHETALQYEVSVLEQELQSLDSKDLDKRIQIWVSLVLCRSRLFSLTRSAPRTEEIISPRRLRALMTKRTCKVVNS